MGYRKLSDDYQTRLSRALAIEQEDGIIDATEGLHEIQSA